MPAKPVQVSIDTELLTRIDRDPEAVARGRSAFIRSAVELYLAAKGRQELESRLAQAYAGQADGMLEEVVELLGQRLPRSPRPFADRPPKWSSAWRRD